MVFIKKEEPEREDDYPLRLLAFGELAKFPEGYCVKNVLAIQSEKGTHICLDCRISR